MTQCPVCEEAFPTQEVLEAHVNSHFAGDTTIRSADGVDQPERHHESQQEEEGCFVCGYPLAGLSGDEKQLHMNGCLDGSADEASAVAQERTDSRVDPEWTGPSKPGTQHDWAIRKVDKGDQWWDPLASSANGLQSLPANFSPSLHPIIKNLLAASSNTAHAVLSSPAIHIRYSFGFDTTWGCGYRNALMLISALLLNCPQYRRIFSPEAQGSDPGVRRVQGWIEQAWAAGYDQMGRDQLRGRVLGTRKWIGTTELYTMFSWMGVGCRLYDFPKPERKGKADGGAHVAVQRWVKAYFTGAREARGSGAEAEPSRESGHEAIMRSPASSSWRGVQMSPRLPLILQHSGHSRTIVGYEETRGGAINLILFDPGRTIPKLARAAGINHLKERSTTGEAGPSRPSKRSRAVEQSGHQKYEALPFRRPYMNSEWSTADTPEDAQTMRGGSIHVADDEEVDDEGWVRKKVSKVKDALGRRSKDGEGDSSKVLGHFRVNLSALGRQTQYQILAFDGVSVLSKDERGSRKEVTSTVIH